MFSTAVADPANVDEAEDQYFRSLKKKKMWIGIFAFTTIIAFFIEVFSCQSTTLKASDVIDVLVSHLTGQTPKSEYADVVIWEYNMPRAIMGAFVGFSLAVGGCIMQIILRNPLATPYTTGVSAGASMGAAIFLYLDIAILPLPDMNMTIAVNAIVFAMIPTFAILLVARQRHITPTMMILSGIAMMYIFSAATTLLMLLAPHAESVESAYTWTVGSLGRVRWDNIWIVIFVVIISVIILQLISKQIHMMNAGQRSATTMGVNVRFYRNFALFITATMTAVVVGVTGGIGFMGLIAPHLARLVVGSDLKYLLPCSGFLSATILLIADSFAKVVMTSGIPVGIITSVIGGPIFIMILIRNAKKIWF